MVIHVNSGSHYHSKDSESFPGRWAVKRGLAVKGVSIVYYGGWPSGYTLLAVVMVCLPILILGIMDIPPPSYMEV